MMIFYYHTGWYMEKIIKEIVKETLKLNVNKEINDNDDLINLDEFQNHNVMPVHFYIGKNR